MNQIPNSILLENIFLQSSNVIAITNADFDNLRFEYVNPAFLKMTGYKLEEVIGKSPKILQGPKTKREMTKRLKESCLKGESFRGDNINYKKDGSIYMVGWTVTPIKDAEGNIINFLSIQKDITQLKELEEKNIKTQKFEALTQISSGLTHELNTALTKCKGSLEMMGYGIDSIEDEQNKNHIQEDMLEVNKGLEYISFLTNSLHYLTNTEFYLSDYENISSILLEILTSNKRLKDITSCSINGMSIFDKEFKLEEIFYTIDKKSFKHLLIIIIDNALDELIKNDKNTNSLDIKISKKENVIIEITDNAGGITKEKIDKIFDPHFRDKQLGGLGIGLYVAKNIVIAHGGNLDVTSPELESTTTFKITI
jgi:PAS domain S-box-containing protein